MSSKPKRESKYNSGGRSKLGGNNGTNPNQNDTNRSSLAEHQPPKQQKIHPPQQQKIHPPQHQQIHPSQQEQIHGPQQQQQYQHQLHQYRKPCSLLEEHQYSRQFQQFNQQSQQLPPQQSSLQPPPSVQIPSQYIGPFVVPVQHQLIAPPQQFFIPMGNFQHSTSFSYTNSHIQLSVPPQFAPRIQGPTRVHEYIPPHAVPLMSQNFDNIEEIKKRSHAIPIIHPITRREIHYQGDNNNHNDISKHNDKKEENRNKLNPDHNNTCYFASNSVDVINTISPDTIKVHSESNLNQNDEINFFSLCTIHKTENVLDTKTLENPTENVQIYPNTLDHLNSSSTEITFGNKICEHSFDSSEMIVSDINEEKIEKDIDEIRLEIIEKLNLSCSSSSFEDIAPKYNTREQSTSPLRLSNSNQLENQHQDLQEISNHKSRQYYRNNNCYFNPRHNYYNKRNRSYSQREHKNYHQNFNCQSKTNNYRKNNAQNHSQYHNYKQCDLQTRNYNQYGNYNRYRSRHERQRLQSEPQLSVVKQEETQVIQILKNDKRRPEQNKIVKILSRSDDNISNSISSTTTVENVCCKGTTMVTPSMEFTHSSRKIEIECNNNWKDFIQNEVQTKSLENNQKLEETHENQQMPSEEIKQIEIPSVTEKLIELPQSLKTLESNWNDIQNEVKTKSLENYEKLEEKSHLKVNETEEIQQTPIEKIELNKNPLIKEKFEEKIKSENSEIIDEKNIKELKIEENENQQLLSEIREKIKTNIQNEEDSKVHEKKSNFHNTLNAFLPKPNCNKMTVKNVSTTTDIKNDNRKYTIKDLLRIRDQMRIQPVVLNCYVDCIKQQQNSLNKTNSNVDLSQNCMANLNVNKMSRSRSQNRVRKQQQQHHHHHYYDQQHKIPMTNTPMIYVNLNLNQNIKLNETENAWKPSHLQKQDQYEENEKILRKVRGILNKLTFDKFDVLVEQILQLPIDTPEKINSVMILVYEKAIDEPNFAASYARLCQKLGDKNVQCTTSKSTEINRASSFRNALLCKTEKEFTTNVLDLQSKQAKLQPIYDEITQCTNSKKLIELKSILEEEEYKYRQRSRGTVCFIGELFKISMLTGRIIQNCINQLLDGNSEDKLECLCKLLTTVGEKYEQTCIRDTKTNFNLNDVIKKIKEIINKKDDSSSARITSRVRFMLQDVIDLRQNNWISKVPNNSISTINTNEKNNLTKTNDKNCTKNKQNSPKKKNKQQQQQNCGSTSNQQQQQHKNQNKQSQQGKKKMQNQKNDNKNSNQYHYNMVALGECKSYQQSKTSESSPVSSLSSTPTKLKMIDKNKLEPLFEPNIDPNMKLGDGSLYKYWQMRNKKSEQTSNDNAKQKGNNDNNKISVTENTILVKTASKISNLNDNSVREIKNSTCGGTKDDSNVIQDQIDNISLATTISGTNSVFELINVNRTVIDLIESMMEESLEVCFNQIWQHISKTYYEEIFIHIFCEYLHLGETRKQHRKILSDFIVFLIEKHNDTSIIDYLLIGYGEFCKIVNDIIIDVPETFLYVFDILGPLLMKKFIKLQQLQNSDLTNNHMGGYFLKNIIKYFTNEHENGKILFQNIWKESNCKIEEEFFTKNNIEKFINENDLQFLKNNTENSNKYEIMMNTNENKNLDEILVNVKLLLHNSSDSACFHDISMYLKKQKIKTNDNEFIYKFTRIIFEFLICQNDKNPTNQYKIDSNSFHFKCLPLLQFCLDKNIESNELQCLNAIKDYICERNDQSNNQIGFQILHDIFYKLWETDIISEESFFKWREDLKQMQQQKQQQKRKTRQKYPKNYNIEKIILRALDSFYNPIN